MSTLDHFQRDFFPNTERHTLTFEITSDEWQTIQKIASENKWDIDDGLRHLLAFGVAYAQDQIQLKKLELSDIKIEEELHRLRNERMTVESRYAVMKFRTFNFMQAAKILKMKLNACQSNVESLRKANEHLRKRLGIADNEGH